MKAIYGHISEERDKQLNYVRKVLSRKEDRNVKKQEALQECITYFYNFLKFKR